MKVVRTESGPALLVSRRGFLAGAASLAAALGVPLDVLAQAAAPYSLTHGNFQITVVSDGHLLIPFAVLTPDAKPDELEPLLKSLGVRIEAGQVVPETNSPVIRSGSDLILMDTGSGKGFAPTAGKQDENLRAAGIDPGLITKVVFTHAHPDHIWGTVVDGKLRFPNAQYYVGGREWDFWMAPDLAAKMPKEMEAFVLGAQEHLSAVKDRVIRLKGGDEVASGIGVIDTPGHTPGHLSFEVAGGDGLIVTADSIASPIFFEHPEWKFGFDSDPQLAIDNRKALLGRAAAEKKLLLGFHWPYPGLARAEAKDAGFRYVPET